MTENEALAFIERHRWTFAKTMPQWPHEWVARKNVPDDEFDAFVRFIRRYGVARVFGRKIYVCYYAPNGWRYWTMGWPVDETVIINRSAPEHDSTRELKDGERLRYSSDTGGPPIGFQP